MNKDKIWVTLLIGISIGLIGLGKTEKGVWLQGVITNLFSPIQGWANFIENELKMRKENVKLKKEIMKLVMERERFKMLEIENKTLKEMLKFQEEKEEYKLKLAEIIGRENLPIGGRVVINKGRIDGIEKELPVITVGGVYGKIIEVKSKTSIVETIYDFNFRAPVINVRTGVQGIVEHSPSYGIMVKVPINSDIKVGDEFITSSISTIFPEGIKVGKVRKVKVDETRLFYNAIIDIGMEFYKVNEVFVIVGVDTVREEEVRYDTKVWKIRGEKKVSEEVWEKMEPKIRVP